MMGYLKYAFVTMQTTLRAALADFVDFRSQVKESCCVLKRVVLNRAVVALESSIVILA